MRSFLPAPPVTETHTRVGKTQSLRPHFPTTPFQPHTALRWDRIRARQHHAKHAFVIAKDVIGVKLLRGVKNLAVMAKFQIHALTRNGMIWSMTPAAAVLLTAVVMLIAWETSVYPLAHGVLSLPWTKDGPPVFTNLQRICPPVSVRHSQMSYTSALRTGAVVSVLRALCAGGVMYRPRV